MLREVYGPMPMPATFCERCGLKLESIGRGERRHVIEGRYDHVQRVLLHGRWSPEEKAWLAAQLMRSGVTVRGLPPPSPLSPPRGPREEYHL